MTSPGFPAPPPLNSAPLKRTHARFWLEGQPGQAGVGIVEELGGVVKQFTFSPAQFSVVLALAEKSLKDVDLPNWRSLRGFLSKGQLERRLSEWDVSGWYLTKHVFRTRKTLSEIGQVGELDGWAWAHEFLETSELGAYRLSLRPENVFIN